MINVHHPVRKGSLVNQDGQFEIQGIVARGSTNIAVKAVGTQGGDELDGGMEVDLPSLIDFCKLILMETGDLPKWFFIGVIIDASHSQLMTYFSPNKESFFSDIYQYIKGNLAGDLPMMDTETVVKNFFENNRDFLFNYQMIPLESFLTGSKGGKVDSHGHPFLNRLKYRQTFYQTHRSCLLTFLFSDRAFWQMGTSGGEEADLGAME